MVQYDKLLIVYIDEVSNSPGTSFMSVPSFKVSIRVNFFESIFLNLITPVPLTTKNFSFFV